jgi:hypothetical protein
MCRLNVSFTYTISYCKDNIKCDRASNVPKCPPKQQCVRHSNTCCQTLKHFDNVFATGGNNIVDVFGSSIPTHGELHYIQLHMILFVRFSVTCEKSLVFFLGTSFSYSNVQG